MCAASVPVLRFIDSTCALAQSAGSEVLATYVQVVFLQSRSLRLERVRTDAEQTQKKISTSFYFPLLQQCSEVLILG